MYACMYMLNHPLSIGWFQTSIIGSLSGCLVQQPPVSKSEFHVLGAISPQSVWVNPSPQLHRV